MPFPFRNYVNENGGVVRAHVVTEQTEGQVHTTDGVRDALAGDVVVEHQNGHFVDIMDGDDFSGVYSEASDDDLRALAEEQTETVGGQGRVQRGYDPKNRTAKDVREYLAQVSSREEYERVAQAERDGRNRSSAIPDRSWDE